ncbi:amino acid adenylation domain-containing protein [Streptomyces tricolor]|uniref:Amino acid adenylation domain-containing protein n=2 Tax=Streptomyces tricolor TaxID=68277 RepID=A0ABS9JRN5_9ACTN|nr:MULTISPECIES: non-ribosomal peptide synthetase [Streptomyces]MCG0068229.1 amino acid adenylation domain-containing protein [Streptomyces tricolor]
MADHRSTAEDPRGRADALSAERRALLTLELARRRAATNRPVRRPRPGPEPRFPLSYAQERLWFLDQADPGTTAYVMPGGMRLRGPLDPEALGRALTEIVRRHEALRTTFPAEGGKPQQCIGRPRPVPLPVTDLRTAAPQDREAAVAECCRAEAARPFDLTRDLMLRARLLRLADDDHVLLLSLHHIAADGWTLDVLKHEIGVLYTAFRQGTEHDLPELEVQYADYAVWQRDWLGQGLLREQLAYWRERLKDTPVLELPADFPGTAERTWRGASVPFTVPARLWQKVGALAGRSGVTPYMVLVAAFAVVLSRWSGQRDLVVGSPVAGRSHPELERLAGFFVNTLPLRVDLYGAPSFATLLEQVRVTCTDAYAHQEVPFGTLVQALAPDRSQGPVPLVQVMLALCDTPAEDLALDGVRAQELDVVLTGRSSKFDLVLDLVAARDGRLRGRVEFSTDLFANATAEAIGQAFVHVLTAATGDPDLPVDRLPLLSPEERDRVLYELSGGGDARAADTAGCLHPLIDRTAEKAPDAPAVRCGDVTLTYRDLVERANALAHDLRGLGAGPEQLVGVCLPKSADMVVALLAILKAGAGYMPLDPRYPHQRVQLMVRDSQVPVVVTDAAVAASGLLAPPADGTGPRLVLIEESARRRSDPPADLAAARTLAYVIYTSGSTGVPKGSANEHGGVVNTLLGLNRCLGLGASDRMLAISSLNYDMSVYEIFGPLLAGGCVVVPRDDDVTDPERLRRLLVDTGVTAWSSAPALLEMLVAHAGGHGGLPGSALRLAVLGGDRPAPTLADRLAGLVPDVRLYNLAGMTETSYCTLYHLVRRPEPVPGSIPWGRPLPNQRVYVLDRHGEPVPVGVRGELFVGGAAVRRGYWRRPGLTAQRFVPDPFGAVPGGRLYRTGDAARWRVGGELEFLGRLDHQVKLRGLRIEPGEIEVALAAHPDVERGVVLLRGEGLDQRLVAYLTASGPLPPSSGELRRFLREQLPAHMVPSAFVLLDRLPLLPSGKLDRSALPDVTPARPEAVAYVAPAGPLEEVLAGVWADVLKVDRVGAGDDFFELGGHSLLVTQAVSRIRDLFRVDLSIRGFLAASTLPALAAHLRATADAQGVDADRVADLVLQVGAMTEEQVKRSLAE